MDYEGFSRKVHQEIWKWLNCAQDVDAKLGECKDHRFPVDLCWPSRRILHDQWPFQSTLGMCQQSNASLLRGATLDSSAASLCFTMRTLPDAVTMAVPVQTIAAPPAFWNTFMYVASRYLDVEQLKSGPSKHPITR